MNTELRKTLLAELADIEFQLQDVTLTHSDRRRLDQVWEDLNDRLDDLEGLFIAIPPIDDRVWRGASDFFEDRTPTPIPSSPLRMAPSPPPLSSTHLLGLHPSRIEIPEGYAETSAPPPPRGWEPDDDEIDRWNAIEDDRDGCATCAGCQYCGGGGRYDGADEV